MKCSECRYLYKDRCGAIPIDKYIEDPEEEFEECDYYHEKEKEV